MVVERTSHLLQAYDSKFIIYLILKHKKKLEKRKESNFLGHYSRAISRKKGKWKNHYKFSHKDKIQVQV